MKTTTTPLPLSAIIDAATPGGWWTSGAPRVNDASGACVVMTHMQLAAEQQAANAQLIARCSPETMRKVLSILEDLSRYAKAATYPDGPCLKHEDMKEVLETLALLNGQTLP